MSLKRDLALVSVLSDIFLLNITIFFSSFFFFLIFFYLSSTYMGLPCYSCADHPGGLRGQGMG